MANWRYTEEHNNGMCDYHFDFPGLVEDADDPNSDYFPCGAEEGKKLAQRLNAYDALLAACKDFVAKVDRGEARSVRSYAQMKAAIELAEGKEFPL